jgi:hypothetical protein
MGVRPKLASVTGVLERSCRDISVWTAPEGEDGERVHLPDIVLTLDGLEQVPTNASGVLEVSLDETPQQIGVSTPGWRLVTRTSWDHWGSVFADTGRFTVESGYLDVVLEPAGD